MVRAVSGPLFDLWAAGGPFIGTDGRPNTVITCEVGWVLGEYNLPVGDFKKPPLRYVQTEAQDQVETIVPNVQSVQIDRSIDQDAATITIQMVNQQHNAIDDPNINPEEFGNPGYFTFNRGDAPASLTLWGHQPNSWNDVLVPNCLVRSYQGFGGHDKSLADALEDGNLVQTGVWLLDEVKPSTGGQLQLTGRDLAKLLIDQPLYPPLVPMYDANSCDVYPLRYARYFSIPGSQTATIYYGEGGAIATTRYIRGIEYAPTSSPCRPDLEGYWMVGSDGGVFGYGFVNFHGSLSGTTLNQPAIGLAATGTNNGYWLATADGGVFCYGDADFFESLPSLGVPVTNIVAIERSRGGSGYLLAGSDGGVFAFGDAVYSGNGVGIITGTVVGFDVRQTGSTGYWLCTNTGHVYAFGAAGYFGGINGASGITDVVGFASTPTDAGYYLVRSDGAVYAYGDAQYHGGANNLTLNDPITDIAVHPSGGYWLAAEDGGVFTYGPGMSFYGSLPGPWVNLAQVDGNMFDLTDVVKDLVRWSGLWLYDGGVSPEPHGTFESTGIVSNDQDGRLPEELFDRKPSIDVINELKAIVGYCHDESTEIFTRRGWLRHYELRTGDYTLAVDPETRESCWRKIEFVYRKHKSGLMYSLEGRDHSSLTTADHRWLTYETRGGPGFVREEALWRTTGTLNRRCAIPKAASCRDLPKEPKYRDEFVELVAWWWTEGSLAGRGGGISQSVRVNPKNVARIHEIFRALYGEPGPLWKGKRFDVEAMKSAIAMVRSGGAASAASRKYGISTSTIIKWAKAEDHPKPVWPIWNRHEPNQAGGLLFRFGPEILAELLAVAPTSPPAAPSPTGRRSVAKVPTREFLLDLTQDQLDRYIQASVDADGHHHVHDNAKWNDKRALWQKDPEAVASFEFACALAGIATGTVRIPYRDNIYRIGLHTKRTTKPVDVAYKQGNVGAVPAYYSGIIWCPVVDEFGNFLARRNGKPFYSGNSFRIDSDGAAHFSSPNWWQPGNYLPNGDHTDVLPEINEGVNMTAYGVLYGDKSMRSQITIASYQPLEGVPGTVITNYTPVNAPALRGLHKPFEWVNKVFIKAEEQQIMAELIDLHINMQRRLGSVNCVANPLLEVGDQVRIVERETSESYVHFVRGISTTHDLVSGKYSMSLQTNWLGDEDDWAIFTPSALVKPATVHVTTTIGAVGITGASTGSPAPGTVVVPATIPTPLVTV